MSVAADNNPSLAADVQHRSVLQRGFPPIQAAAKAQTQFPRSSLPATSSCSGRVTCGCSLDCSAGQGEETEEMTAPARSAAIRSAHRRPLSHCQSPLEGSTERGSSSSASRFADAPPLDCVSDMCESFPASPRAHACTICRTFKFGSVARLQGCHEGARSRGRCSTECQLSEERWSGCVSGTGGNRANPVVVRPSTC
ncbi:hypothetical protein OH76DRAFT_835421 [Lentinus brumalis]|uniref:Uncharacterized protein n=1 Tax=Lentinus brumalis TaxID=2498619 RepID=A0A371D1Y8_9APHY|nr:hypothetical protein OH76DRAFT_835421 [Polyporus brumalis]